MFISWNKQSIIFEIGAKSDQIGIAEIYKKKKKSRRHSFFFKYTHTHMLTVIASSQGQCNR